MLLRSRLTTSLLATIALVLMIAPASRSYGADADSGLTPGAQNLNLEANDPLASFRQLQFRTNWNTSRWQSDTGSTDYEFRAIYPYRAWNHPNIIRFIVPFSTEPSQEHALKDIEISNLAVYDRCWGRFGFGLSATIAANPALEESDASVGPAEAFVVNPNKNFQWGLFNKNFLTATPRLSTLQPILTYSFSNGWDVGPSSMIWVYDWHANEMVSEPVGVQVGKVFNLGNQPARTWVEAEYNFKDIPGNTKFRVLLGLALLIGR